MTFALTAEEWHLLDRLPVDDLVQLAADLDILIPSEIERRALLERCIPLMLERCRREGGLPLSKYDTDDLRELPPEQLAAIARLQGLPSSASVAAVLKVGERIHKARSAARRGADPYAFMVPILLAPLARLAADS